MKSWIEEPALPEEKLSKNSELAKSYIQNCMRFGECVANSMDNSISSEHGIIFPINQENFSATISFYNGLQRINIREGSKENVSTEINVMRKDHCALVKIICENSNKSKTIYEIPLNVSFTEITEFKKQFAFPDGYSSIAITL